MINICKFKIQPSNFLYVLERKDKTAIEQKIDIMFILSFSKDN